jgi:hypothetical protein
MVCSSERQGGRFPFDIQHRTIIPYKPDSVQDFAELRTSITDRIKALLNKREVVRRIEESEQVATTHGLSAPEILIVANLAGDTGVLHSTTSMHMLKEDCERGGLTAVGFSLGLRRLMSKKFAETVEEEGYNGEAYTAARLTDAAWQWIEKNSDVFVLKRDPPAKRKKPSIDDFDDDIPF